MKTSFTIDDVHPTINRWAITWHHYKRAKVKKEWEEKIMIACANCTPIKGPVSVLVEYYFPTKRLRDIDNYTPKFILDGMVKAGLIEEDNNSIIKQLSVSILYDKNNPHTVVTVEQH